MVVEHARLNSMTFVLINMPSNATKILILLIDSFGTIKKEEYLKFIAREG